VHCSSEYVLWWWLSRCVAHWWCRCQHLVFRVWTRAVSCLAVVAGPTGSPRKIFTLLVTMPCDFMQHLWTLCQSEMGKRGHKCVPAIHKVTRYKPASSSPSSFYRLFSRSVCSGRQVAQVFLQPGCPSCNLANRIKTVMKML